MNNFLFVDIETNGLDELNNSILEIYACTVTDDFCPMDSFHRVLSYSGKDHNEWIEKTHTNNGLLKECIVSTDFLYNVSNNFECFINCYLPYGKIILAGFSVHFDKKFLLHNFEWLKDKLNYRLLDLRSTLLLDPKEGKQILLPYPKDNHRAMPDCLNAVYTAKYYQCYLNK